MSQHHDVNDEQIQKHTSIYNEYINDPATQAELARIDTVDVINYDGIHIKTVLAYISILLLCFAQLTNIVGAGAVSDPESWADKDLF